MQSTTVALSGIPQNMMNTPKFMAIPDTAENINSTKSDMDSV